MKKYVIGVLLMFTFETTKWTNHYNSSLQFHLIQQENQEIFPCRPNNKDSCI